MYIYKYVYGGVYDIYHVRFAHAVYCVTKSTRKRIRKLSSILASATTLGSTSLPPGLIFHDY